MIDLFNIANDAVQPVNSDMLGKFYASTGAVLGVGRSQIPQFRVAQDVSLQVQGVSARQLRHLEQLNIQGVLRAVHMRGNGQGVVRVNQQGGDLLYFPEVPDGVPRVWKIIQVLETWATWARVIVNLQTDKNPPAPPVADGGYQPPGYQPPGYQPSGFDP